MSAIEWSEDFSFLSARDLKAPLPISIGLAGGSGSGKTHSAIQLAIGMADTIAGKTGAPIAFVDTENRRGLHYARAYPQIAQHFVDLSPYGPSGEIIGFPPERWIALIDRVEASGAKALVIDSWSHSWSGINGVLELQAAELDRMTGGDASKRDKKSMLAWAAIKPRYRRLINRVIQCRVPVVLCIRAKSVIQKPGGGNAVPTKLRRRDIPWDVDSDKDLIFEMTALVVLDGEPGCPTHQIKVNDQHKAIFRPDVPISFETGMQMAEWSMDRGDAHEIKALMDAARTEARAGLEPFREWFRGLSRISKGHLQLIMPELKIIAERAEAAAGQVDDPFADTGGPDADTGGLDADTGAIENDE